MALDASSIGPAATPPEMEAWEIAHVEHRNLASSLASLLNPDDKDLQYALLNVIKGMNADDHKKIESWMIRIKTHGDLIALRSRVHPNNENIVNLIKKSKGDVEEHFALQSQMVSIVLDRLAKKSVEKGGAELAPFITPEEEAVMNHKTPFRFGRATLPTKNRFEGKPIADRVDQVVQWIAEFASGSGELVRRKSAALPDFRDVDYAHKTLAEAYAKIDPKASAEEKEARVRHLKMLNSSLTMIERNVDPIGYAQKFTAMNSMEFALSHTKEGTRSLLQKYGFLDKNGNPRRDVLARNNARYGKSFNIVRNGGRIAGIGVAGTLFLISAMAVTKKISGKQTLRGHDYLLTLGYGGGALLLAGGISKGRKLSEEEKEAARMKKEAAKDKLSMSPAEEKNLTMIASASTLPMNGEFTDALNPMGGKEKAGVSIATSMHEALQRHPEKKMLLQETLAQKRSIDQSMLQDILGEKSPAYFAMTKEHVLTEHRNIVIKQMLENNIEREENLLAVVTALEYHA
ncbi:MAG TPA: hypothetical protein VJB82_02125 [Candidatus Peribacterales bacterium]|nr:hypothetical protein [Candidatus Peribacterales bacterium]